MGGVGGDDEDGLASGGEEDGEDGAARRLPHPALPPDEHPLEALLLQEVPHRRVRHRAVAAAVRHRSPRSRAVAGGGGEGGGEGRGGEIWGRETTTPVVVRVGATCKNSFPSQLLSSPRFFTFVPPARFYFHLCTFYHLCPVFVREMKIF